jgi:DNA polymerase III alpha subunit
MGKMPNQRSINAGGVSISDEPITYYTALDLPPKGMPTVQWDMYEAEDIGYDKYDILSQRGICQIKEAVKLVLQNQGKTIDIHQVKDFMKDPNLNESLKTGNTIGCFYIESPAMRQLLTKLVCDNYLTLVTASLIIRPGVAQSGMVEFDRLVEKFHEGAKVLGRPEQVTNEVWRQVSSFAGYSFSKAHSASFAVESYQSLYLKTYYPIEFMVGVLNNYGGFYTRWLYVHELKRAGATVHLPCVNHSTAVVSICGTDAYLGFVGIQWLEGKLMELIPEERRVNGDYVDLEDFLRRTEMGLEQVVILIRCGAFRFTGKSKKALLWEAHTMLGQKAKPSAHAELFHMQSKRYVLPDLVNTKLEDAYHELELLGFPLTLSMFDLLKTAYRGDIRTNQLIKYVGQTVRMVGLYVCEKTVQY